MISTVSASSHPSEGQMIVKHMDDDIVHNKGSRVGVSLNVLDVALVLAEAVNNEGLARVLTY
jgi:hypothetical protein